MSSDGDYLLINISLEVPEILLFKIGNPSEQQEIIFIGHIQENFIIETSFGGIFNELILSGSEAEMLMVWNWKTGKLITSLKGH